MYLACRCQQMLLSNLVKQSTQRCPKYPAMSDDKLSRPFWWQAAEPPELPQTPVSSSCDAVVVGAGYTGLSAALTLARAGRSVQVFDKQRPGEGASTRNGGIFSASIRTGLAKAIAKYGEQGGVALYREAHAAREDLGRFVREEGIDCDYNLNGRFTGAVTAADYEALAQDAELLNKYFDVGAYAVEKSRQHEEVGSDFYHGGVVLPDIGHLHPAKLHAGMLGKAIEAGAIVHGETPVTGIARGARDFSVATARGDVTSRDLIVAINGYADAAFAWMQRRIVPVISRIIATEQLSPNLMSHLIPKGRAVGDTRKLYRYYRPSPDGTRIIIGGRERMFGKDPAVNAEHIRRGLVQIFPELDGVAFEKSWNGFVAFNRDELPRLFRHEGAYYACGYCGSGVVWARWLGAKAAYKVLGDRERGRTAFEAPPPASIPFYTGKPWFMPLMIGLYGLQDRTAGRA